MTNNQNIIITPNAGQPTGNASIVFQGGNSTVGPMTMNIVIYPTGTLSFENASYPLVQIANAAGTVLVVNGSASASSLTLTAPQGTAPLVVTSNTVVANLNADLLDGQHGSFYQNVANLTGTIQASMMPALTGDVTTNAGSTETTLQTVNTTPGSFGSNAAVPIITVDGKGRLTAISTAPLGTAATYSVGASGATIPLLSGNNAWGGPQTFGSYVLAPTPAAGTSATNVATTAFVYNASQGVVTVPLVGSSLTLTAAQYSSPVILLTGTLSQNINVVFPSTGEWTVRNNTTGSFTVTLTTAGGTSTKVVAQGQSRSVASVNSTSGIIDADSDRTGMTSGMTWASDGSYDIGTPNGSRPRSIYATGSLTLNSGSVFFSTRLYMAASGPSQLILANAATGAGLNSILFGGILPSNPALYFSGTTSQFRLADNSADAPMSASSGTFSGPIVSTVATGTAPLNITSTTQVNNLNAQFLGGQSLSQVTNAANLTGVLPAASLPALSGDVSSTGTTTTLAIVNSTPGPFGSGTQVPALTVDGKGRVTAITNVALTPAWTSLSGVPAGVTSLAGLTGPGVVTATGTGSLTMVYVGAANSTDIPNLAAADTRYVRLGGSIMSGALLLSGDPTTALGAATKQYVDNNSQGLVTRQAVRVATTGANITLSGLQALDGYTVQAGDRVLVKDQTDPTTNGVYVAAAGAWSLASDFNAWVDYPNAYVFVQTGILNGSSGWNCNVSKTGTLGSTPITWTQFSSSTSYTGSNGVVVLGQTIQLTGQALTLQNYSSTGLMTYRGGGVFSGVQFVAPASGLAISNATGVGGNPTFTLADDLAAIEGLSTTGYAKRTGTSTWTAQSIPDGDLPVTLTGHTLAGNTTITGPVVSTDDLIVDGPNFIVNTVNKSNAIMAYDVRRNGTSVGGFQVDGTARAPTIALTAASGTAPLTISSTTLVTNLNADLLDGQQGSFYQNASNLTTGTLLAARMPALTGDVTSSAGSAATTLATVLGNPGVFGDAATVPQITVDGKGRVTTVSNVAVAPAWSAITGTPTTLAGYGITDAVSAANSIFTNAVLMPLGSATAPSLGLGSNTTGFYSGFLNQSVDVAVAGAQAFQITGVGINSTRTNASVIVSTGGGFSIAPGIAGVAVPDINLLRDGTGVIGMRNLMNWATGIRAYNTYTDTANYERAAFDWQTTTNVLTIGPQASGTGILRNVSFVGNSFSFANTVILPAGSQSSPSLNFGTANTGIWGQGANTITVMVNAAVSAVFDSTGLRSGNTSGAKIANIAASGTVPSLVPNYQNLHSGIGASVLGNVTLISNSVNVLDVSNAGITLNAPLTFSSPIVSTVATGTAPLTVSSTTLVSNLNAQYLNGQSWTYYLNVSNMALGTLADARLPTSFIGKATLQFTAADASGIAFWAGSTSQNGIGMSLVGDVTYGGRLDTSSDYNIYYRISGGTNRGHAFVGTNGLVAQITGGGQFYLSPTSAGTSPFVLSANATGMVSNLNSQYLNGLPSSAFALLAGAAFSGSISSTGTITTNAVGQAFGLQAGSGTNNTYIGMANSAGILRWTLGIDGDATSQFQLCRYNTSGVLTDTPLSVSTSDGSLTFRLPNGAWINSADGVNRLNYTAAGRSYYKSGDGTHEWRNGADLAKMNLDASGNLVLQGGLTVGAANALTIGTTASISSTQGGKIVLANGTASNFTAVQFGGTTSSYPSLYTIGSTLKVRLADNSGDAPLTTGAITASGVLTLSNGSLTAPAVNFGDTQTGLYRYGSGQIGVSVAGSALFVTDSTGIWSTNSNGPSFRNAAASSTVPTFVPNRTNTTSGLGASVAGNVTVIANSVNAIDISNVAVTVALPLNASSLTVGGVPAMTTQTGVTAPQMPALTGDISTSAGSTATTLATVNANVGVFGSGTQVPALTVDGKGRVTSVVNVAVTPSWASITSKPTTLLGYGITDGVSSVNGGTFTGAVSFSNVIAGTTPAAGDSSGNVATTSFVYNATQGISNISLSGTSYTLTAAQYSSPIIVLTGTLTSNITVVFPNNGCWTVYNGTSGAFSVTVKCLNGTTTRVISQGQTRSIIAENLFMLDQDSDVTNLVSPLNFQTDNAYDIGGVGANRPRNLYVASNAAVGGSLTVGGVAAMTTQTGLAASQMPALTGDASSSVGSTTLTLATVNGNPNTFGNATTIPQVTVDGKGRVTSVTNVTVNPTQLNGQPASYYTNGSNISTGTVPLARLPWSSSGSNLAVLSVNNTWSGTNNFANGISVNGVAMGNVVTQNIGTSGAAVPLLTGNNIWSGVQVFGQVDAQTPNNGTAGGLRLRANTTTNQAYFQITDPTATTQWGLLSFANTGQMIYNGQTTINAANSATGGNFLALYPTDLGAGKSGLFFQKTPGQEKWTMGSWDGAGANGATASLTMTFSNVVLQNSGGTSPTGANLIIDGNPSIARTIQYTTNGVLRWGFNCTTETETGSNLGSNFKIWRYMDNGVSIDSPLTITRSTGTVAIGGGGLTVGAGIGASSAVAGGTTGAISAASSTGVGYAALLPGDSHTGFVGFYLPSGTRQGYIGYVASGGAIVINNDQNHGIQLSGGDTTVSNNLWVNGGTINVATGGGIWFTSGSGVYNDSGTADISIRTFDGTNYHFSSFGTNGTFTSAGDVVAFSDARLKTNVVPIVGAKEIVRGLHGRRFDWKSDGRASIGFIAQEVQEIVPEMVHEAKNGEEMILAVAYDKAAPILVEALKETLDDVDELKVLVAALRSEIEELRKAR